MRGSEVLFRFSWLVLRLYALRIFGLYTPQKGGRLTRLVLDRLGGIWIKIGQLLSLRVDLFSAEFCSEIAKLQDQASGFPLSEVRRIIEEELGCPLEDRFSRFEEEPFAAASTAQVHRAYVDRDRTIVAIKVQRPEVAASMTKEMRMLGRVVYFFELTGFRPFMRWRQMLDELRQVMIEELDYKFEAANLRRMRKVLKAHRIFVPHVFRELSTTRLLVTEFVSGMQMSDYIQLAEKAPDELAAWEAENNVDPRLVGKRLTASLLRQLFEDNLYHGDLHPGNIILLRDSRACFIDMGTVGTTDMEFLANYEIFMRAMGVGNFAKAADTLMILGSSIPISDMRDLREELIRALRDFSARTHVRGLPYHQKSVSMISTELIRILAESGCSPDWSFLRIRRAEQTLDASLIYLTPDSNYSKSVTRFFRKKDHRRINKLFFGRDPLPVELMAAIPNLLDMRKELSDGMVYAAPSLRRNSINVELIASKTEFLIYSIVGNILGVTIAAGIYLSLAAAYQIWPSLGVTFGEAVVTKLDAVPKLTPFAWTLVAVGYVMILRASVRVWSRFRSPDIRRAGAERVSL